MTYKSEKEDYKIKIAIVGCGRISKKHITAIIKEYNRCELVALCDNNEISIDNKISKFSKNEVNKNVKNKGSFLKLDLEFDDHLILWFMKSLIVLIAFVFTNELGSIWVYPLLIFEIDWTKYISSPDILLLTGWNPPISK